MGIKTSMADAFMGWRAHSSPAMILGRGIGGLLMFYSFVLATITFYYSAEYAFWTIMVGLGASVPIDGQLPVEVLFFGTEYATTGFYWAVAQLLSFWTYPWYIQFVFTIMTASGIFLVTQYMFHDFGKSAPGDIMGTSADTFNSHHIHNYEHLLELQHQVLAAIDHEPSRQRVEKLIMAYRQSKQKQVGELLKEQQSRQSPVQQQLERMNEAFSNVAELLTLERQRTANMIARSPQATK